MDVHIVTVEWFDKQDVLKDIRLEVFVNEQAVSIEEEIDLFNDPDNPYCRIRSV